ncbi:MAG: hypothetical protein WCE64_14790, partial [Bacteroidales bacterium]
MHDLAGWIIMAGSLRGEPLNGSTKQSFSPVPQLNFGRWPCRTHNNGRVIARRTAQRFDEAIRFTGPAIKL